jgi:hypothetical protein
VGGATRLLRHAGHVQIPQPPTGLPSVLVNRLPFAMQIGLAVPQPGEYMIRFGSSTVMTDFDAIFVRATEGQLNIDSGSSRTPTPPARKTPERCS